MARIVVIEKRLGARVEIIVAQTRQADSPYYRINPSGRVPYLVRDYLDQLDGQPMFEPPSLEARRLEALARSLADGLSVWNREVMRPPGERSPGVIAHERERSRRLAAAWEREMGNPAMRGALNMAQLTLGCALGLEARNRTIDWRSGHPRLAAWFGEIDARPSFAATAPPRA
jgi:glutathione S-transferase